MKVLVTGSDGQLARELKKLVPDKIDLVSFNAKALDISDRSRVYEVLMARSPDLVINTAAYTGVDNAETDKTRAYAVNDLGCEYLASACNKIGAKMIHISTDFVFDGTKNQPYQISDIPKPLNVYGASKLAGEIKVNNILGSKATIIRTAWLYSVNGNNFVKTMLKLMSAREPLGIVYDQVGAPTWARGLAKMIWALIDKTNLDVQTKQEPLSLSPSKLASVAKLLHWTDAGAASKYEFSTAIQELAVEKGLLKQSIPLSAIATSNYPTPASRPIFSVLDTKSAETASGLSTVHWREQLSEMLDELADSER